MFNHLFYFENKILKKVYFMNKIIYEIFNEESCGCTLSLTVFPQ